MLIVAIHITQTLALECGLYQRQLRRYLMTNQANNTQATQPVKAAGIGAAWAMSMQTITSTLSMVNNLAVTGENITGVMADKSIHFREQQQIAETMKHNALMSELQKQAEELGIDI